MITTLKEADKLQSLTRFLLRLLFESRIAVCSETLHDCFNPCQILYEVTVVTGDIQNAGTDTSVYMTLFGSSGNTEEMRLEKNGERYSILSSLFLKNRQQQSSAFKFKHSQGPAPAPTEVNGKRAIDHFQVVVLDLTAQWEEIYCATSDISSLGICTSLGVYPVSMQS